MRLEKAIQFYLDEFARRASKTGHRKYETILEYFLDDYEHKALEEITREDCELFLNRWRKSAKTTQGLHHTILNQLFERMRKWGYIDHSPMENVQRPKVPHSEDREVTTIDAEQAKKIWEACETWTEKLCIGVLAFMGVRRQAASDLRWKDVNLATWRIRFREKGNKVVVKPIPYELVSLLEYAYYSGQLDTSPNAYVIPNVGAARRDPREARFIWAVVKKVGEKAGVDVHCHAFRAFFAVQYLESHEGDLEALRPLMGHTNLATTQIYLRKLKTEQAMERVRDLDYGWGTLSGRDTETPSDGQRQTEKLPDSNKLRGKDSNLDYLRIQAERPTQRTKKRHVR